ncbi:unnamed protein product [Microthlaspi erraticum]|uniref:F-box domain-containing protein n=1 Tax=Microthlaspi erraticum TaxID=1685480 RepID=A0A6D2L0V0_9BRAS|nr:unnamed protein product [Microthlaspi erraticum]
MNSIPIDLSFDIFSRLSSKSIARCRCVSKQWDSMLQRPDFKELFLTRSRFRPRILFALCESGERDELLFFSSPQHQIPYENSSLEVAPDFHMKLPGKGDEEDIWGYASGLMYFPNMWNAKKGEDRVNVICNPSTGLCVDLPKLDLPKLRTDVHSTSYLGFDPIDKQFKVLFITKSSSDHRILTLGTGKMSWREIKCSLTHIIPQGKGICINGVLYYLGRHCGYGSYMIVCFDVRSEKFKFVDGGYIFCYDTKLVNYKGKLGVIVEYWSYDDASVDETVTLDLSIWVLDDIEKQEWSEHEFTLRDDYFFHNHNVSVVGLTADGEIVLLSLEHNFGAFYVLFFNPEGNTLQSVRFRAKHEGLSSGSNTVYAFLNHEEDLEFNIRKTTYAATSSNAQLRGRFESNNIFNALCLSDND